MVLGGVSIGLALSIPILWPLVLVGVIPLVHMVYVHTSLRQTFLFGWLFGSTLVGSTLYWFFNALPLGWLGISNPLLEVVLVAFFWALLSIVLGIAVGLWALVAKKVAKKSLVDVVSLSLLWILFEYMRMWLYTGAAYGFGAAFDPFFSFGFVGYALAHNYYALQLASLGGVFVLSATAVAANILFYFAFQRLFRRTCVILCVGVLVCGVLPAPANVYDPIRLNIYPIETNIQSSLTSTSQQRTDKHAYITQKLEAAFAEHQNVSVFVLPESSNYTQQFESVDARSFFEQIFGGREVLLIDSVRTEHEYGASSDIVFFSTTRGELSRQSKRFLLPFGEYVPVLGAAALRIFSLGEELDALKQHRSYVSATSTKSVTFEGVSYSVLTCSDAVSPTLYRKMNNSIDTVLVNTSSLAWFHHAQNPFIQFLAIAKVHAVWSRSWYVQATNAGKSFFVTPNGHVLFL